MRRSALSLQPCEGSSADCFHYNYILIHRAYWLFKFDVVAVMGVILPLCLRADGLLIIISECTERRRDRDGGGGVISLRNKK